jgi:hypothetical protein
MTYIIVSFRHNVSIFHPPVDILLFKQFFSNSVSKGNRNAFLLKWSHIIILCNQYVIFWHCICFNDVVSKTGGCKILSIRGKYHAAYYTCISKQGME